MLRISLFIFITLFLFACGDDADHHTTPFNPGDIAGIWSIEDTKITQNSCNFANEEEDKAYLKITKHSDTEIEFFNCKDDQVCAGGKTIGKYPPEFPLSMNLPDSIVDIGKYYQKECVVTFKIEVTISLKDGTTGTSISKGVTQYSGKDCPELKEQFKDTTDELEKEFAKFLNGECLYDTENTLKKK